MMVEQKEKEKNKPNTRQQECIENIDGEIMVLAGPGTGKTFTLINRVKNMIDKGLNPSSLLCLTFSDAAAGEMQRRFISEIGEIAGDVNVFTYHSFCNEILNNYPEEFETYSNFKLIDTSTKRIFIKKCIDELNPQFFRTQNYDSYFYIPKIIELIEEIKKNLLSKEEYFYNLENHPDWKPKLAEYKNTLKDKTEKQEKITATLLNNIESLEKRIGKAEELWSFYELYKKMMQDKSLIDFNDMINFVLEKFNKNKSFLEKIANSYEYFLVDEYQDTNKSQNAIIFNLVKASAKKNVFVVGDDDQIIYGFQGAQIDNIEKFLAEFPDTKVICLNENMRSTQSILDFSYNVAKLDLKRLEVNPKFAKFEICKELKSTNEEIIKKNKLVKFNKYFDLDQEYISIVEEIEQLLNSSDCPTNKSGEKNLSEVAILAKTNNELTIFSEMLKTKNIPYELKDGKSIFSIKSSILLYSYIKMLVNPYLHSDKIFQLLLNEPFNINPKDYEQLLFQKKLHKNQFFIDDIKALKDLKWENKEKIENVLNTYDELNKYKNSENLKNVVLEIANKTGILKYFLTNETNKAENISGIKKIIDEANNLYANNPTVTLEDFAEYLNVAFENDIPILTAKSPIPLNAVQLVTYHSSKGREFEYVYLPTLENRKWESDNKSPGNPPIPLKTVLTEEEKKDLKLSERIKLLFVGITRAKHSLTLSFPQTIGGKDKKLTKLISAFVDSETVESKEIENTQEDFITNMIKVITKKDFDYKKEFDTYLKNRLESLNLSASSINTYVKCPRQFLYSKVLELSIKSGNKDALNYGSAVHYSCETMLKDAVENQKYMSKHEFIRYFEKDLSEREISDIKIRKDFIERGKNNLDKFYFQLTNTPISSLFKAEYPINNFKIGEIKLTGAIDRIEINEDGTYSLFDYKTGKSKAKSIKDGGDHEDYLNQLRLYKYMFEKITGNKVTKSGFLFPDDCENNYDITLTDEDNEFIENVVIETYNNIRSLNFDPKDDDEKTCQYCGYKDFCKLNVL